ncbi:hypothetical protein Dimus_003900, partial [Dionaea muscipula]
GEQTEKEAEGAESGSGEKYYDAADEERFAEVDVAAQEVVVLAPAIQTNVLQKEKTTSSGVDPSGPSGHLSDLELIQLQAEYARALQSNTRFQELYQQMKSKPSASPKP